MFDCSIVHLHYALFHTYDMQPIHILLHVNSCGKTEQCAPNFHRQEAAGYAGCKALLNTFIWKIKQLQWPEAIYPSRDLQTYTYFAFCFLGTFLGLQNCFQLTSIIFLNYYSLFPTLLLQLSHTYISSKKFVQHYCTYMWLQQYFKKV